MGPKNNLKMRPDNELLLEESLGEEQSPSDQTDDHCPVLSYHLNGDLHHNLVDTTSQKASDHDITKNCCHSSLLTKPTKSITMEPQVSLNGWGDHHDSTLLTTKQKSHQLHNGLLKNSVSSNVKLDINKNHHCELPPNAAQNAHSSIFQQEMAVKCLSGGTSNGAVPHQNGRNIPIKSICLNSQAKSSESNKLVNGTSNKHSKSSSKHEMYEEAPYHIVLMCYLSYVVLMVFGYLRDFMRKTGIEKNMAAVEINREGYPRLYKSFESFYTRNIYRRIRDCWNRPIASVPGAYIDVVDRVSNDYNWTFETPGTTHQVVNMGSYNYLGFAENKGPIHEQILDTLKNKAVGVCSVRGELGTSNTVEELENLMAQFLGVESCIVFGMGFATNSTNIACFAKKGCLIVSDELNHASLILGCRLSGATIRVFKHNDMNDLERKVRKFIVEGQPKTRRPWKKIIIFAEGVYSMEGTIINLPELIRIKKRYNCYIYLDEAHSIGALGPHGRGVVDYYNCDPNDVDVLMGTFTKSFGSAGGYLAGRKELVDHVRANSFSCTYANSMSPVVAKQIMGVVQVLMGLDGTDQGAKRISQLARNTRYFRRKLSQMGFIVYGNDDSPVVPLLLCFCPKIAAVIRLAHEKGLGFIGAGFPATSLTAGRVRFCISASHTKELLDQSLEVMNEIGDQIGIKYSRHPRETRFISYDEV